MRKTLTFYFFLKITKAVLLLLMLTFPLSVFSQDYININRDLGLRTDLVFGSKVHPDAESYTLNDGYYSEARIEHPIFNRLRFEYNNTGGLTSYTYYCDSAKNTEQNKGRILAVAKRYYGNPVVQDGATWKFTKSDDHVLFTVNHDSCQMTVYTFNNIKAVDEYDQLEKQRVILTKGYTNNQFEDYVGNEKTGERRLFFKGIISAKAIRMYYTMITSASKTLKIRLDDSVNISIRPRKKFMSGYYISYMFDLPREIADKFYRCSKITLITTGKDSDEVEVPDQILYMYRITYRALYNQN